MDLKKNNIEIEVKPKNKRGLKITGIVLAVLLAIGIFFAYGPITFFRELWITSAMTTLNHKYLATWFYSQDTIDSVMNKNMIIESNEDTNTNDIIYIPPSQSDVYASKYEEQILKRDANAVYKQIDISGAKYKGYLIAIYDASRVSLAQTRTLGTRGDLVTTIAKNNNAIVAMNAGGFVDENWMGHGGTPTGTVISNSKLTWNKYSPGMSGGVIGFNKENKLVLTRQGGDAALALGIRDAVDFGPFLIVNGKASFVKGNGGWGIAPRTAIAQRRDGIVLFLVIDGRQTSSLGADMIDLVEILQNYGAYNAANMDGGSSSGLVVNNKIVNKPVAGGGDGLRFIPNAWIVK